MNPKQPSQSLLDLFYEKISKGNKALCLKFKPIRVIEVVEIETPTTSEVIKVAKLEIEITKCDDFLGVLPLKKERAVIEMCHSSYGCLWRVLKTYTFVASLNRFVDNHEQYQSMHLFTQEQRDRVEKILNSPDSQKIKKWPQDNLEPYIKNPTN